MVDQVLKLCLANSDVQISAEMVSSLDNNFNHLPTLGIIKRPSQKTSADDIPNLSPIPSIVTVTATTTTDTGPGTESTSTHSKLSITAPTPSRPVIKAPSISQSVSADSFMIQQSRHCSIYPPTIKKPYRRRSNSVAIRPSTAAFKNYEHEHESKENHELHISKPNWSGPPKPVTVPHQLTQIQTPIQLRQRQQVANVAQLTQVPLARINQSDHEHELFGRTVIFTMDDGRPPIFGNGLIIGSHSHFNSNSNPNRNCNRGNRPRSRALANDNNLVYNETIIAVLYIKHH